MNWMRIGCLSAVLIVGSLAGGAIASPWSNAWSGARSTRRVATRASGSERTSSEQDQAARAALRRAVTLLENDQISREQFEELVPRADIPRWQRLQRQIPVPRPGSADLAFVLAYYGVEYAQNLDRLQQPYRRWRRLCTRLRCRVSAHDQGVIETLPGDLEILYGKHRDAVSLGALLDLQLDLASTEAGTDGSAAGAQMAALHRVWINHAPAMLWAASAAPGRLQNLAWSLALANDNTYDREEALRQLDDLCQHADLRVAQAAGKVRTRLLAIYSRCPSLSR
jgi:hypothetical protein